MDIFSLGTRESVAGKTFNCFGCNERVIARLGEKRTRHFAHKANGVCNRETYLHKLGKKVFQEEYELCLASHSPFYFELEQSSCCNRFPGDSEASCRTYPKLKQHCLTQLCPRICVEEQRDVFRPDIALESLDGKIAIWIEIFVTHRCTEEKQKKNRIIEIKIQDESDLQLIRSRLLTQADQRVTFYKFRKEIPTNMCAWPYQKCNLERKIFRLFKDNHWDCVPAHKADRTVETESGVVWWKDFLYDRRLQPATGRQAQYELESILEQCAFEASQDGFHIRACVFCEHFDQQTERCQKFNRFVSLKQAVDCKEYSIKDSDDTSEPNW